MCKMELYQKETKDKEDVTIRFSLSRLLNLRILKIKFYNGSFPHCNIDVPTN